MLFWRPFSLPAIHSNTQWQPTTFSSAECRMCKLQQLCVRPQNNHQKCTVSVVHHRNHGNRRVTQITHTRVLYNVIFSGRWVNMEHWRNDKYTGKPRSWDGNLHQCHFIRHIPNRLEWIRTRASVLGYVRVGEFLICVWAFLSILCLMQISFSSVRWKKEPWPNLRHCSN